MVSDSVSSWHIQPSKERTKYQVANNIRVYELARELGMTNAQVIDLCGTLGIGVKGHSSGMPEPQADRVRRKAIREGLATEVKKEKPAAKKPAAKKPAAESGDKE